MRKLWLPTLGLFTLFLLSCQQEVNDIISQAQQCRIRTGYYYGGSGVMNDSAKFEYNGAGQLVRISNRDGYYVFQYANNRIVERKFIDSMSSDVLFLDSARYDGAGRMTEFKTYDYTGWFGFDTSVVKRIFHYTNNQLSRIEEIELYNNGGLPLTDTFATRVYWDGGGNITKMVGIDAFGDPVDSMMYQYNTHPNYFKVAHPHFFLFDPQFQLHAGFVMNLPYFWSRNNVINTNPYGVFDNPIDYGLDSMQRVTSVDMGGSEYYKYRYTCP